MFTNWINYRLAARDPTVSDLYTDLVDGWVLYELLEELSGQSLASLGKMNKGKMRIQRVANMNIPFKYLKDTVKVGEWRGATKQGAGSKAGAGGRWRGRHASDEQIETTLLALASRGFEGLSGYKSRNWRMPRADSAMRSSSGAGLAYSLTRPSFCSAAAERKMAPAICRGRLGEGERWEWKWAGW